MSESFIMWAGTELPRKCTESCYVAQPSFRIPYRVVAGIMLCLTVDARG